MDPTYVDHFLVLVLAALFPVLGVLEYRQLVAAVEAGRPDPRVPFYRRALLIEWGVTIALLIYWTWIGRDLDVLGLGFKMGTGPGIGLGLGVAIVLLLLVQLKMMTSTDERLERMRPQLDPMRPLLPHDDREMGWFRTLSMTAGICEELLYRGFLIAYFVVLFGLWPAVVLSSVVFGMGHLYQGWKGVIKTGIVGAVLAGFYLLTGSLWVPMLLHAVLDLTSGQIGRSVIERLPASPAPSGD